MVGLVLALAWPSSRAADEFPLSFQIQTNGDLRMEFPALTSDYYFVRSTEDLLTNSAWALTGLVLGVDGNLAWQDANVVIRDLQRFYRVVARDVTQPLDSDGDGIDDVYELRHAEFLDPLDPQDAAQDADGDGVDNQHEYAHGMDPQAADTDADGMGDAWELANGLNPLADDAGADADGDGLANLQEHDVGTDPRNADSDADGLDDYEEVVEIGTDPWDADTDDDGLPDLWETAAGLDPLANGGSDGAAGDPDDDDW